MGGSAIQSLVIVLSIVILAYFTTDRAFRTRKLRIGAGAFAIYGIEFIIVGIILGRGGFNLIDPLSDAAFRPLLVLALSWAGLLFGLQFKHRHLMMLRLSSYRVAVSSSLLVIVAVAVIMAGANFFLIPSPTGGEAIAFALALGACASASSIAIVTSVVSQLKSKGYATRLLRVISALDGGVGIIIMTTAIAVARHLTDIGLAGPLWLLSSLFLGGLLGILYSVMLRLPLTSDQRLAIAAGMIAFAAGVAHYLPASPLFISVVAGVVLANTSKRADDFYRMLAAGERPLYGLLLIIAGASWQWNGFGFVPALIIFIAARFAAKVFGTDFALKWAHVVPGYRWIGFGLIGMGGLSLVMAFDYYLLVPSRMGQDLLELVLLAIAVNSIIGPVLAKRVILKSKEEHR